MSFAIVDSEDTQKYTNEEIIKIEDRAYNKALEDFIHTYYHYCEIQYGILADDELVDMIKVKEKLIKI